MSRISTDNYVLVVTNCIKATFLPVDFKSYKSVVGCQKVNVAKMHKIYIHVILWYLMDLNNLHYFKAIIGVVEQVQTNRL